MNQKLNYTSTLTIVFFICLIGTGASFLLQYVFYYNPCPLCIFQRLSIMATGAISLTALLMPSKKKCLRISIIILVLIPALSGLVFALRQIYLQNLPTSLYHSCGPGLNCLTENNSYIMILQKVWAGSGECVKVEKLFYVPLPIWSMIMFLIIIVLMILGLLLTRHNQIYSSK